MALNIQARGGVTSQGSSGSFDDFLSDLGKSLTETGAIDDLAGFIDAITYKGFDAQRTRDLAIQTFHASGILKLVTIGALRGSAAVSLNAKSGGDPELHSMEIRLNNGSSKTISQLYSGRQLYAEKNSGKVLGKNFLTKPCTTADHLTIQRLVAAFPDMAAYGLMQVEKRGSLNKRVNTNLPAWLIFPAAASLPFAEDHKADIKDMCVKFSALIGGSFDEAIFNLQWANRISLSRHPIHEHIMEVASQNMVGGNVSPYIITESPE